MPFLRGALNEMVTENVQKQYLGTLWMQKTILLASLFMVFPLPDPVSIIKYV
jgi:hypothetical protein